MIKQIVGFLVKNGQTIAPDELSLLIVKKKGRKKGICEPLADFALMHYLWKHVYTSSSSVVTY